MSDVGSSKLKSLSGALSAERSRESSIDLWNNRTKWMCFCKGIVERLECVHFEKSVGKLLTRSQITDRQSNRESSIRSQINKYEVKESLRRRKKNNLIRKYARVSHTEMANYIFAHLTIKLAFAETFGSINWIQSLAHTCPLRCLSYKLMLLVQDVASIPFITFKLKYLWTDGGDGGGDSDDATIWNEMKYEGKRKSTQCAQKPIRFNTFFRVKALMKRQNATCVNANMAMSTCIGCESMREVLFSFFFSYLAGGSIQS